MWKKILGSVVIVIVLFVGIVATRDGKFRYERSGLINVPASKIFPFISQFKLGEQWSPYEEDKSMKKSFEGAEGQVGSKMIFESKESGSGTLEILSIVPDQQVDIDLTMTAPFYAKNLVTYKLTPEGDATRFTWTMSGDGGFMGKLITLFIDCDKMMGDQFERGIAKLKNISEPPQ